LDATPIALPHADGEEMDIENLDHLIMRAAHHEPKAVAFIPPTVNFFLAHPEIEVRLRMGSIFIKVGGQSYTLYRNRDTKEVWFFRRADPNRTPVHEPLDLRRAHKRFMELHDGSMFEAYANRVVARRLTQLLLDAAKANKKAA
jgi:hypothetical protein